MLFKKLPPETLDTIFTFLDCKSLISTMQTSRFFKQAGKNYLSTTNYKKIKALLNDKFTSQPEKILHAIDFLIDKIDRPILYLVLAKRIHKEVERSSYSSYDDPDSTLETKYAIMQKIIANEPFEHIADESESKICDYILQALRKHFGLAGYFARATFKDDFLHIAALCAIKSLLEKDPTHDAITTLNHNVSRVPLPSSCEKLFYCKDNVAFMNNEPLQDAIMSRAENLVYLHKDWPEIELIIEKAENYGAKLLEQFAPKETKKQSM